MGVHAPSRRRQIFTGFVSSTLSTGDDQGGFPIPWKSAYLVGFGFSLDAGGSGSGNTSVMLNRVQDETDAELLSAVLSVAHDATTVSNSTRTTFQNNELEEGDIVRVDIDAVPGTPSSGLFWWAEVHIDQR